MFWVSQNGQEIGQFTAADLTSLWAKGEIGITACYWLPGMTEWRSVEEILAYEAPDFEDVSATALFTAAERVTQVGDKKPNKNHLNFLTRRGISTEGLTRETAANLVEKTRQEEKLRRNLATPRQRACLEYHGIVMGADLGSDDASAIIDGLDFGESNWMQERHLRYPHLYNEQTTVPMSERQKAFLDYHGIKYDADTSSQMASALIQKVIDDPAHDGSEWNQRKHELYPHLYSDEY